MKSVLISINPKWVEKIISGKKTIEVRKTAPKEVPFKAYIYCTKGRDLLREVSCWNTKTKNHKTNYRIINLDYCTNKIANGKVIGEFICNEVEEFHEWELSPQGKFADFERERLENFLTAACLSEEEVVHYRENLPYFKPLYGWHISDLKIYDKPKEWREFRPICKFEGKDAICALFCQKWKYDGGLFFECTRKVTRPPQSWQYVEELENEQRRDN